MALQIQQDWQKHGSFLGLVIKTQLVFENLIPFSHTPPPHSYWHAIQVSATSILTLHTMTSWTNRRKTKRQHQRFNETSIFVSVFT